MAKQPSASSPPRLCPTCGTRVGELATKCIVCGADLGGPADTAKPQRQWRSLLPPRPTFKTPASRSAPNQPTPAGTGATSSASAATGNPATSPSSPIAPPATRGGITLPVPVALAIILIFVAMGAVLLLSAMGKIPLFKESTPTVTLTITPTATFTLAPTATNTPAPSPTPLPPLSYTVAPGDSCISIAVHFNISVQALLNANGLSQACPLIAGQPLQVPLPTYTPTALPTNTLEPGALTETAKPRTTYTVKAGDTLFSIAAQYGVDYQCVAKENGIPGPDYVVALGDTLSVPLDCPVPTAGPTPTNTSLPPYPAPSLLSPADGAAISPVEQSVILQWAAVDVLKEAKRI